MRNVVQHTAILLGILLISVSVLMAADLTVFVGGVKPGDITLANVKTPLESNPVFGARVATNFVPMLGMEHTLAFNSNYLLPQNSARNAKGFVCNSNLIINIPLGSVVPYITAGVGLLHQYGSPDLPVGTKFAVNYGGGLKLPKMVGPLGLRIDVRGYNARGVFSHTVNMLEMSGGIVLSF